MSSTRCSCSAQRCRRRRPRRPPSHPAPSLRPTRSWLRCMCSDLSSSICSGSCRCPPKGRTSACRWEDRPVAPQRWLPSVQRRDLTESRRTRRPGEGRLGKRSIFETPAQFDSDPAEPSRLEEDRPASRQQPGQSSFDPAANFLGQIENQPRVVCALRAETRNVDRLSKSDEPLGGQRNQARQPEPGKRWCDRNDGKPKQPRERLEVEHHRVQLLRTDDRDRDDRRPRPQRDLDETSAAQSPDSVPISIALGRALHSFRENSDELVTFEQCRCVVGMREHVAGLDEQHVRERHREGPVDDQHASVPRMRVLRHDRRADHRAVVRNDTGVVRHQQCPTSSRDILNALNLDPPVVAIEPERNALDSRGEFGIEAEFVVSWLHHLAGADHTKSPHLVRVWQHADGLDMAIDLQAAATEYLGWLQLEANRSPNTVRAYASELNKLLVFLKANHHSLSIEDLRHDDLRAYQRHLAGRLTSPASRARALVAVRPWRRGIAKDALHKRAFPTGITLPKPEQRLPKPIDPDELTRLLGALPRQTPHEKRDRALVQFLISTGCRISEALALDRTDFPRSGNRLVVTGKGSKQRSVYLTTDAREALEEYLSVREDACMALFVNYDRAAADDRARRLTSAGARFIVRKLRVQLGAWSFKSPHVARHTAATTLLEVTGGDVRLVQEVLGHANLNTLQGYTKIVDSRKQDAYRRYQEFLDEKKPGSEYLRVVELKQSKLLQGLPDSELRSLEKQMKPVQHPAGHEITVLGE